MELPKWCITN